jgi:thioredoxin 2
VGKIWAQARVPDPFPGEEDEDVVALTEETFERRIADDLDVAWFVLFYVATCEHCKQMAGEFQDFATRASLRERGLRVAKVNSEKEEALSARWVTVGFPTMKLIVDGKVITYDGDRNADAM